MPDNFDNIANIPAITRRDFKRWTIWEDIGSEPSGKRKKVPRLPSGLPMPAPDPMTGEKFHITENCGDFSSVIEICRKHPGKYYPGFWFIKEDGVIVMDSDMKEAPDFPTYTEKSISPNSFHMIGWYDKNKPLPKIKGVGETYTGPHWIVLTGDCLPGKNVVNDMNDYLVPFIESVKEEGVIKPFKINQDEKYDEGKRYPTIKSYVLSERYKGVPLDVIIESAKVLNRNHFVPPHEDSYIVKIVNEFYHNIKNTPEFEAKIKEEAELKLVDTSGIVSQMKKLDNVKPIVDGTRIGPSVTHNGEDGDYEVKNKITVPEHLLKIPGVLQKVVDYYNITSIKDQPQFAVVAAISYGAMVTQRRYKTDQNNYTSCYNIDVGDTSCGKEHIKTVLEKLAQEADILKLIGPSGYTSAGGVFSSLYKKPAHLSIIDELGRQMESSKKDKNANSDTATTTMMEIFGRNDNIHRPKGYSKMNDIMKQQDKITRKKKDDDDVEDADGVKKQKISGGKKVKILPDVDEIYINHPALSIVAMTTPQNFYESISSSLICDGFLPRFLVVETEYGRPLSKKIINAPIDFELIRWTKDHVKNRARMFVKENEYADMEHDPKFAPEPIVVPFDVSCDQMLEDYELDINKRMDDAGVLKDMYGKTKEITMKLSLLIALSCESQFIYPEHLKWAMDYVSYYTDKMVDKLKYTIADSKFEAVCNDLYRIIEKKGTKGLSYAEIHSSCRKSREYSIEIIKKMIMPSLEMDYGIKYCPIKNKDGSNSKRYAWVTKVIAEQFEDYYGDKE